MQLAPGVPDPASIPDLTFGVGSQGYDQFQVLGAALESGLLNNVNLTGLFQRLGYDPETAINTALGAALTQALAGVPINVGGVPVLGPILTDDKITNVAALLELLGFDLANPLGDAPGLNIITVGPPFTLLKFLGADLGWVPGFPNSVADDVNGTPYLDISALAVLQSLDTSSLSFENKLALTTLIGTVKTLLGSGNTVGVRVPVVVGFGLGAFAAGMAYPQVVADLPNQPGGANYAGTSPLAGSFTILPIILLRNPGRANGGLFARFYPEAALLGINTVTPDTEVSSSVKPGSGLNIPIGNTGIVVGGANLIPIKVDGTVEYDPLSDFPAWPNPVALANSAAALAFPTYILRGVTSASLTEVVSQQLNPQLAAALANTSGPLALNLYLTVPVNGALPLLEPVKLPVDVINLFTGANLNNPVATALEPALTSLVNLGYTDVKRNVVNGVPQYDRTLDQANVITPFGTLPSGVDWGQVPGDLIVQLAAGTQRAVAGGLVGSTPVANPLATLANLLGVNLPGTASTSNGIADLTGLTGSAVGAVNAAAGATAPAAQPQAQLPSSAKTQALYTTDLGTVVTPATGPVTRTATTGAAEPDNPIRTTTTSIERAAKRAQSRADASVKRATERLDKIAKDGQRQIQNAVKQAQDDINKTVKTAAEAHKPADKPSDKTSE